MLVAMLVNARNLKNQAEKWLNKIRTKKRRKHGEWEMHCKLNKKNYILRLYIERKKER